MNPDGLAVDGYASFSLILAPSDIGNGYENRKYKWYSNMKANVSIGISSASAEVNAETSCVLEKSPFDSSSVIIMRRGFFEPSPAVPEF
jgi:hypothetical protein